MSRRSFPNHTTNRAYTYLPTTLPSPSPSTIPISSHLTTHLPVPHLHDRTNRTSACRLAPSSQLGVTNPTPPVPPTCPPRSYRRRQPVPALPKRRPKPSLHAPTDKPNPRKPNDSPNHPVPDDKTERYEMNDYPSYPVISSPVSETGIIYTTERGTRMSSYDESLGGFFDKFLAKAWPGQYEATLVFETIAGGVPSDPKVAEGWIRSKMSKENRKDDRIQQAVEQIMAERGVTEKEAIEELNSKRNCNGFYTDSDTGQLYIEGRQIKAALKEAVSVAVAAGKLEAKRWGKTGKGAISFAAEHIQVMTGKVFLYDEDWKPVTAPTRVNQSFPVNPITRQTGIQYTEICDGVQTKVIVTTDWEFTEEQWGMIWLTGERQGIGASRSQDRGRYKVTNWVRQEVGV